MPHEEYLKRKAAWDAAWQASAKAEREAMRGKGEAMARLLEDIASVHSLGAQQKASEAIANWRA